MAHPLSQPTKEKLSQKLVDTLAHLKDLEEQKKASLAGFKEMIGLAKSRADCLADTLKGGDLTRLMEVFHVDEIEVLTGERPRLEDLDMGDEPPF